MDDELQGRTLGNPNTKKKFPLMPFEKKKKKKKILHGMALAKLSFKPPKKIFLLKCFSLKFTKISMIILQDQP